MENGLLRARVTNSDARKSPQQKHRGNRSENIFPQAASPFGWCILEDVY